uniref:Uncharacterized protein n=1 Tax=Romanomermis culicivorax TaxID=13658 RepID=A0A915KGZ9_ROMCU
MHFWARTLNNNQRLFLMTKLIDKLVMNEYCIQGVSNVYSTFVSSLAEPFHSNLKLNGRIPMHYLILKK